MKGASRLTTALFMLTLAAAACTPQETVRISPTPSQTAPATTAPAATTPAPTRTATATPTTPPPTATSSPQPTTSPGSTPPAACAPQTGGSTANRAILTDVRVAHHPGYDRLVFELGPSTGPGTYGVPPYTIDVASSFVGPSGQPVQVAGNAFFRVRFQNTDAHNQSGQTTVSSTDLKPTTPLIREVRLVEDFEAVNVWGVGLERLACAQVSTLTGPVRVVLDFPTPP